MLNYTWWWWRDSGGGGGSVLLLLVVMTMTMTMVMMMTGILKSGEIYLYLLPVLLYQTIPRDCFLYLFQTLFYMA